MANGTDQTKAYSEACNTLRHYSNASLAVRAGSVVQGLAMLLGWVTTLMQPLPRRLLVFGLPLAGLVFTALLYRFHLGYFRAAEFFYEAAAKMEKKFFDEDCRPMAAYDAKHQQLYRSVWARFFTLHAPFTLIAIFFAFALLVDVLLFCR
jgi:hypothetical protein